MHAAIGLIVLIGSLLTAQSVGAGQSLEFQFPSAQLEKPDERTISRLRKRPMNLRCELVRFDAERLLALIEKVESGVFSIEETSLTLRLFEGEKGHFTGQYFEAVRHRHEPGPFSWTGRRDEDAYFIATFVIGHNNRAKAYIRSIEGEYSLSPSDWSDDYFLCEHDPTRLPTKID